MKKNFIDQNIFTKGFYVFLVGLPIALMAVFVLKNSLPLGPIVLAMTTIPLLGLVYAERSIIGAIPDIIFGAIDTGLLAIPALVGGITFGVAGAIVGGVIGDALSDGIAGFFEGYIAEWLRDKGIEESRESISTALGKMSGCLLGSGVVLTIAILLGVQLG